MPLLRLLSARRVRAAAARLAPTSFAFLVCVLSILPLAQAKILMPEWRRIETPHFVLIGDAAEHELRSVLRNVEIYRAAMRALNPRLLDDAPGPRPRVFVLREGTWKRYLTAPPDVYGRLVARDFSVDIAFDASRPAAERRGALYLLGMHQLDTLAREPLPLAYRVGIAHFVSTVDVEGGRMRIGVAPPNLMAALGANPYWIDWREVLGRRDYTKLSVTRIALFEAQSWLLMHFAHTTRRELLPKLDALAHALTVGQRLDAAIAATLGADFEVLTRELEAYGRRTELPYISLPEPEVRTADTRDTGIPDREGIAQLALMALRDDGGRPGLARRVRRLAAEGEIEAMTGALAMVQLRQGRLRDATDTRAACATSPSAAALRLCGRAYQLLGLPHEIADELLREPQVMLPADIDLATPELAFGNELLERARRLDPEDHEALLWRISLLPTAEQQKAETRAELEAAIAALPRADSLRLLAAQIYLELGLKEQARTHLMRVALDSRDRVARGSATRRLARLE